MNQINSGRNCLFDTYTITIQNDTFDIFQDVADRFYRTEKELPDVFEIVIHDKFGERSIFAISKTDYHAFDDESVVISHPMICIFQGVPFLERGRDSETHYFRVVAHRTDENIKEYNRRIEYIKLIKENKIKISVYF